MMENGVVAVYEDGEEKMIFRTNDFRDGKPTREWVVPIMGTIIKKKGERVFRMMVYRLFHYDKVRSPTEEEESLMTDIP